MNIDILDLLEQRQIEWTINKPVTGPLMEAHCCAVIDGKFYNLQEHSIPLVHLETLGDGPYETIPAPHLFPLFLHDLVCTIDGIEAVVRTPVDCAPGVEAANWSAPRGIFGLPLKGWREWVQSVGMFCVGTRGLKALRFVLHFRAWAAQVNASAIIDVHRASGGPLEGYVRRMPDVAGQQELREYAADLMLSGDAKPRGVGQRGKATSKQRAVLELAALAGVIRKRDSLSSWMRAYERACSERPGWVPASWSDPTERLEKEIAKLKGTRWQGIRGEE